jgi:hypothetical protein
MPEIAGFPVCSASNNNLVFIVFAMLSPLEEKTARNRIFLYSSLIRSFRKKN